MNPGVWDWSSEVESPLVWPTQKTAPFPHVKTKHNSVSLLFCLYLCSKVQHCMVISEVLELDNVFLLSWRRFEFCVFWNGFDCSWEAKDSSSQGAMVCPLLKFSGRLCTDEKRSSWSFDVNARWLFPEFHKLTEFESYTHKWNDSLVLELYSVL